jgi:hypothetical protein
MQGVRRMSSRCVLRGAWLAVAGAAVLLAGVSAVPAAAATEATPASCPAPAIGQVTCAAVITPGTQAVSAAAARASGTALPGLSPDELQDAYGIQSAYAGMRQTVAVVTPWDDPTAEADMGVYRSEYPMPSCTTADGCFPR